MSQLTMMMSRCNEKNCEWVKERKLGSGAFGIVELWRNLKTGETIAIKQCHIRNEQLSARQKERWIQEVEMMKKLNHPNIVGTRNVPQEIFDSKLVLPVLCMEYCTKGSLREVLKKRENFCGVNEAAAIRIMMDVSSGVEFLHANKITHRDLKPENVMLQELQSRKIVYKLIDLGYGKELDEGSADGSIVGTLNYLAPELLWRGKYSITVDYWSLGILFYEILTGTRPFLPNMPLNATWIRNIKSKKYDDISAHEIDGKVRFSTVIEEPTNVSECMRNFMVPWFRLVFQWDPKVRGKNIESYCHDPVVFKMLKEILVMKIIRVFYVTRLKIDYFDVRPEANITEIQQLIYEREAIEINDQILATSGGIVLENKNVPILEQLQDSALILYDGNKLHIDPIPLPKVPRSVVRMSRGSRILVDYFTLKKYYNDTVFFMNQEVELYRTYILSLGSKIDSCDTRFKILCSNIEKMMACAISLKSKVECSSGKETSGMKNAAIFGDTHKNIEMLVSRGKNLQEKVRYLEKYREKLGNNFLDVSEIADISEKLGRALDLQENCQTLNPRVQYEPSSMVKLYLDFLENRMKILSSQKLSETCRSILQFEKMLRQLEMSLKSFETLLPCYEQEIQDILHLNLPKSISNSPTALTSCINTGNILHDDGIILESIKLRYMFDELLARMNDIKKNFETIDEIDNST